MERKLKLCSGCQTMKVIWKAKTKEHGMLCKDCSNKSSNKKLPESKVIRSKPIANFSKSRVEALKKYRRLRDKYFIEHPICEFPDCTSKNITLHHSRGRIGCFLTDKRFFKSLCPKHHRFVEENPTEAQKLGLSQKRLDK